MCAGRSTGFTKPNYRAIQTAFLTTHFSDRATDTLGAPRSHTACTPGSRDMNPSSLTPEPVLNRPLENTSPAASSSIYHTSLQIQRAYVFPGPDFQPRCRENKTILLSRSIGRPPGLRSKAAQHSPASTQSPGSRCAAGSAGVARRAREGPGSRVTLDTAPHSRPQFPCPGLPPGASAEPRAYGAAGPSTHTPQPPAFPPHLRWKAAAPGTPTIAERSLPPAPPAATHRPSPPQAQAGTCTRRTRSHQRRRRRRR